MDVHQFREALESAGWRFSRQRAAVFNYLSSVHSHPTAEEVHDAVRLQVPRISLATVYKALEALVECDLAEKLTSNEGPTRYDAHKGSHYHLRCLRTGQVGDLPTPFDPSLLERLDPNLLENLDRQGFEVTGYRLEVVGQFADR
jgi:Fe2+ or Zn2+ uptake regulation protein